MIELDVNFIIGGDGKTPVKVYDGLSVDYRPTKGYINPTYYVDESGKRWKTRSYNQFTAMTNRCLNNGKHKENYSCYVDVSCSESFKDYDKFIAWAENQVGFMCTDDNGRLYQLDKDILGDGTYYSEDTCCFVPCGLNSAMVGYDKSSFKSKKKIFNRVFDEWFDQLDDKIIEHFIVESSHDYSLSKEDRMFEGEYNDMVEKRDEMQRLYNCIGAVKDDVMSCVNFISGKYWYSFSSNGKVVKIEKGFDNVRDCVLEKLNKRLISLYEIKDEIFSKNYFRNEEMDQILLDKIENIIKNIDGVFNKEIDLPQYVSVSSLALLDGDLKLV